MRKNLVIALLFSLFLLGARYSSDVVGFFTVNETLTVQDDVIIGDAFTIDVDGNAVELTPANLGSIIFNVNGDDTNFVVEGDTDPQLLWIDAGTDRIGIGTVSPKRQFDFDGANVRTQRYLDSDTNTNLGYDSFGAGNLTGTNNSVFGNLGLYSITSGGNNCGLGNEALYSLTSGSDNIAIGYQALLNVTTQGNNVGIGKAALANAASDRNVAIGNLAASDAVFTGSDCVVIGEHAGLAMGVSADYNIYIGSYTGSATTTGKENTAVGGYTMVGGGNTASGIIAVGYWCAHRVQGDYHIFIGHQAGNSATATSTTNPSIGIGKDVLNDLTTGEDNVAIGKDSLSNVTAAHRNIAIGAQTGDAAFTGDDCVLIGDDVGTALTSGSSNTMIGSSVGAAVTTGQDNVCVGYNAGATNTAASSSNVFLGSGAGSQAAAISSSVCIGYQAGSNASLASNTLWIANSNTTTPLIWGDFTAAALTINGSNTTTGAVAAGTTVTGGTGVTATTGDVTSSAGDVVDQYANVRRAYPQQVVAAPAEPFDCLVGVRGWIIYVDDTDDTAESYLCFCGVDADDSSYEWFKANDPTVNCF